MSSSIRVGCDLVRIPDVQHSIANFGDRYLERAFTRHELESCSGPNRVEGLAGRFAAKEAMFKTLRVPDLPVPWLSIEVRRQVGGWCDIRLLGMISRIAVDLRLDKTDLSLSHEGDIAMAVVIATFADKESGVSVDGHRG